MQRSGASIRFAHILHAIEQIERYTFGSTFESFLMNDMLTDATIWNLIVIGEAASRVSPETRNRYPEVPWSQMRGMRNAAVHRYYEIDMDIIWDTIRDDLPVLRDQIHNILDDSPPSGR